MEIEKQDKKIKKVLHRLISEETTKIKKSLVRINYLSHQAEHFSTMFQHIQEEVKESMFKLMKENGWNDWIKELKKELNSEGLNSSQA